MPSSYTPQQKAQISQFVGFTSTKDSVAAKVRSKLSNLWGLHFGPGTCLFSITSFILDFLEMGKSD